MPPAAPLPTTPETDTPRPAQPSLAALGARTPATRETAMAQWLAERRIHVARATLDDVVGLAAAKREVQSLIARLRHPEAIRAAGGELPRAVLLYGPAGTGKTTLARVIASALGEGRRSVPFYELNGSDLTAARLFALRDHFAARPASAGYAVVFLDEVDAIALARHHYTHTPESRRALCALLAVLDGVRATPRVLWLFASNSGPDELDRAVTRAGRMGHHIETSYPTRAEREALFRHFARGRRGADGIDWAKAAEMLGAQTSGADVRGALDDALALALADTGEARLDWPHTVEAIQRRGVVSDRRRPLDPRETRIAAAHVAAASLLGLPVGPVQLDATSGGAFTALDEPEQLRATRLTDAEALDRIAVGLAGTVAERLLLAPGEVSLGGSDDLTRCTALALARIDAGTDPGFRLVSRSAFDPQQPAVLRDQAAAAVAATLADQRARVERLLDAHVPAMAALAARVAAAEHGQLGGAALRDALCAVGLPDPGPAPEEEPAPVWA